MKVAFLLLFICNWSETFAADSDAQKQSLIRSYVNLQIAGCSPATLQSFARVLSGTTDKDAFMIGLTINGLGWASVNNYELYKATYEMLLSKDTNATYTQYLIGDSVTDKCGVCTGPTGRAMQSCDACGGIGKTRGNENLKCPKCNGSGFTPVWCGTCRGVGVVFSPAKANETLRLFLRKAEDRLTQIYGVFSKYLSKEELSRFLGFKVEDALNEGCYNVAVQLYQVLSDGAFDVTSLFRAR
jgi:hypothetical protein